MKSGLYACAGASATASAAACAKRFDEPITKWSKVYFGFSGPVAAPAGAVAAGRSSSSACRFAAAGASTRKRTSSEPPAMSFDVRFLVDAPAAAKRQADDD